VLEILKVEWKGKGFNRGSSTSSSTRGNSRSKDAYYCIELIEDLEDLDWSWYGHIKIFVHIIFKF